MSGGGVRDSFGWGHPLNSLGALPAADTLWEGGETVITDRHLALSVVIRAMLSFDLGFS